jgi:hypothetical protein
MAIYAFRLLKMLDGTPPVIRQWPVTAGQTFKAGEPLTMTAGLAVVCGADPASIGALALQPCAVGGAVAGDVVDVLILTDMTELLGCVQGTAVLNAIQEADLNAVWDIEASSGVWQIDKDSNTRDQIRIMDFIDPVGTVNGRVGFVFRREGTGYAREY